MRTKKFNCLAWLFLVSVCMGAQIAPAAAADGDQYLGTWNGTFLGDDTSGHFELTLQRGADGKLTGSIAVRTDGDSNSDYTASLKSASFAGDKFTAVYEPPADGQSVISLTGTFN